jgi:hypothetical protein
MIPIVVPKAVSTTYSKSEKLPKKNKKHCPQVQIQVKMWQNIFEFSRKFAKIWHTKKNRAGRESFSLFSRKIIE